jgi:hypothetical protein
LPDWESLSRSKAVGVELDAEVEAGLGARFDAGDGRSRLRVNAKEVETADVVGRVDDESRCYSRMPGQRRVDPHDSDPSRGVLWKRESGRCSFPVA